MLMSFLGPVLPAWGYHLRTDYSLAGLYFLATALGIMVSVSVAHRLIPRRGVTFTLILAASIACTALLYLSAVSPPISSWWRTAGIFFLGGASGLLISALFHAISPYYRHDPAATVNIAGALFVSGSLTVALLVSGTFYVYGVGVIIFLLALMPGLFIAIFARTSFTADAERHEPSWREALRDFRSPSAVLFALLLFLQFGNEWSIAGWLPVFLVQRIGVSPDASLLLLAVYWFFLLIGRILAQALLSRVSHTRILMTSAPAALFGCIILLFTKTTFGAVFGILFVGIGYAAIYPLVVEKIGNQFPYFHPTLFNGIFSLAMTGGLLAPWTLGYVADWFGIRTLMLLPLIGTLLVFVVLLLIWLDAKISGRLTTTT
jgi:MFS transporter, FHS family, glucose/mannose:H+ symporter